MRVTDAQTSALRAFLHNDPSITIQLTSCLGDDGMQGYQHLAKAALSIAAARRFARPFTDGDIVRYVASVRASRLQDGDEYDFAPAVGESVLRHSLGLPVLLEGDPQARFQVVIALLDALAESGLRTIADVDELLAEARVLADRWLTTPL